MRMTAMILDRSTMLLGSFEKAFSLMGFQEGMVFGGLHLAKGTSGFLGFIRRSVEAFSWNRTDVARAALNLRNLRVEDCEIKWSGSLLGERQNAMEVISRRPYALKVSNRNNNLVLFVTGANDLYVAYATLPDVSGKYKMIPAILREDVKESDVSAHAFYYAETAVTNLKGLQEIARGFSCMTPSELQRLSALSAQGHKMVDFSQMPDLALN
jgi:hypothetical protein